MLNVKPLAAYAVDEDMTATALLAIVLDLYGTEALEWLPSTLVQEIETDLRIDLPQININRINAAIALMTTDSFYRDPLAFIHTCHMLWADTAPPDADDQSPPSPIATAWGVFEASLLDPENSRKYSEDVKGTIGVILQQVGIRKPPKVLVDVTTMPDSGVTQPPTEIGSDPTIVQAMFNRMTRDAADLDNTVAMRFKDLMNQLHYLPIKSRNNDSWQSLLKRMSKSQQDPLAMAL